MKNAPNTTTPPVKTPIEPTVDPKAMVQAIVQINDAFSSMMRAGLKKATIVTLIHAHTKVAKRDIEAVLYHLENFKRFWTTQA